MVQDIVESEQSVQTGGWIHPRLIPWADPLEHFVWRYSAYLDCRGHISVWMRLSVVMIASWDIEREQIKLNQVIRQVNMWMENHGLLLDTQKPKLVLIMVLRKRIPRLISMHAWTIYNEIKIAVKHIGIMIDLKHTCFVHTKRVSDKVSFLLPF